MQVVLRLTPDTGQKGDRALGQFGQLAVAESIRKKMRLMKNGESWCGAVCIFLCSAEHISHKTTIRFYGTEPGSPTIQ